MSHLVHAASHSPIALPKVETKRPERVRVFDRIQAYRADRRALAELRANEYQGPSRARAEGFVRSDFFRS